MVDDAGKLIGAPEEVEVIDEDEEIAPPDDKRRRLKEETAEPIGEDICFRV